MCMFCSAESNPPDSSCECRSLTTPWISNIILIERGNPMMITLVSGFCIPYSVGQQPSNPGLIGENGGR